MLLASTIVYPAKMRDKVLIDSGNGEMRHHEETAKERNRKREYYANV